MEEVHSQVFTPSNFSELFTVWTRFPKAEIFAGGSALLSGQGARIFSLPQQLISLQKMEELRRINRTERYLELGSMVSLSGILALGKIVPEVLLETIKNTANPQIRNIASIGGNICCTTRCMDCIAPLVALDARYELRSATGSRWVAATRFSTLQQTGLQHEIMSRIRIPLEHWDYIQYRKINAPQLNQADSGVIIMIASAQKDILSDLRLVFAGEQLLRDRDMESSIVGKILPLNRREAVVFLEHLKIKLKESGIKSALLCDRILNFTEAALLELCE